MTNGIHDFVVSRSQGLLLLSTLLLCGAGIGCAKGASAAGGSGSSGSGSGSTPVAVPHVNMSGNWQFAATPTHGSLPFSVLSGFIHEEGTNQALDYSTISFLATSSSCFAGVGTVPFQGGVSGAGQLDVSSFEINGQILVIHGTEDTTGEVFTGTYTVAGGCADGDTGTLTGLRYSALTGTYAGTLSTGSAKQMQLVLRQYDGGTGMATFLVTGSATFTGFGCFSKGTLPATGVGTVSGGSAALTFSTDDPGGAQIQLLGTFDPAATTLTVTSVEVLGGSCPGSLGGATLTHM